MRLARLPRALVVAIGRLMSVADLAHVARVAPNALATARLTAAHAPCRHRTPAQCRAAVRRLVGHNNAAWSACAEHYITTAAARFEPLIGAASSVCERRLRLFPHAATARRTCECVERADDASRCGITIDVVDVVEWTGSAPAAAVGVQMRVGGDGRSADLLPWQVGCLERQLRAPPAFALSSHGHSQAMQWRFTTTAAAARVLATALLAWGDSVRIMRVWRVDDACAQWLSALRGVCGLSASLSVSPYGRALTDPAELAHLGATGARAIA
jgi:hypothetical protein